MNEIICKNCNEKFLSTRKNAKYCSNICRCKGRTKESLEKRICKVCGYEFEEKKSYKREICSKKCRLEWNKSPERNKKMLISFKKTIKERYNVDHPSKLKSSMDKMKKTKLERYGTEGYVNSEKMKKTKLERYGTEGYNNIEKNKKTKKEKYNDENYNNRNKAEKTSIKKYGVKHFAKTEEFKKIASENGKLYGFQTETFKKSMFKKYGFLYNPEHIEKLRKLAKLGDIGFNAKKYKDFLKNNNIENVSQLPEIKERMKKGQYKSTYNRILTEYENYVKPLFSLEEYNGGGYDKLYKFECVKCGHKFEHWVNNGVIPRCEICHPIHTNTSKYEDEISEFIKSIYNGELQNNTREIISPLELDIYLSDKKLAIELNGIYWHSELNGNKDKKYHLNKTEQCEEQGIQLLHIFENEWVLKQDIVKGIIKGYLGIYDKVIYARECKIKEIDTKTKNKFLIENHLQGKDVSGNRFGLYYRDELVSVMTFSKSRFNKNIEWEMYRYANKIGYKITGGASKLFSHFIKNYDTKSIISYSDRRYFNGNVYNKLGFKFIENTTPNYFYCDLKNYLNLENRIKFQKHKLEGLLPEFDINLTEWENMQINGYDRIWDSGNKKFIWNTTNF